MESRVEEIMDSKLSSLPDDIIHKILSTVPMKDVIRTSVLSSRWRYVWASMPYLIFSTGEFCLPAYIEEFFPEFTQFVKHVLSHRNNQVPLTSLKLNISVVDVPTLDIEILIKYILSHNVQQLDVKCFVWWTGKTLIRISQEAAEALKIVRLFQQIQSVKFLTLNQEILEEAIADIKATQASVRMAYLKRFLDKEKDIIETMANRDHMQQPTESMYNDDDNGEPKTQKQLRIRKINKQIQSRWLDHKKLIGEGDWIVNLIGLDLEIIESILTELPASKRAMLQPCFSSLCAESSIFMSKMTERIKIHFSENIINASDRFHELATSLQSHS
ncbi:putative F-box-like domain superfamily protein [Tanacetum coccineum]